MSFTRRKLVSSFASLAFAGLYKNSYATEEYPSRPIRIICGFAAGGAADAASRLIADNLSRRFGKPVIVENRIGASGNLAAQYVAASVADGHTLLLGYDGTLVINPFVYKNAPFNTTSDFSPIGKIGDIGLLLIANPGSGIKTLADVVSTSKSRKGLSVATAGNGTTSHLLLEIINKRTGANLINIPYRGSSPATMAVIGGEVPLAIVGLTGMYQHAKAGSIIPVVLSNMQRFKLIPDVQTLADLGMRDAVVNSWNGLLAPAKTPSVIVERISTELNKIIKDPDVRGKLDLMGFTGEQTSPEEFSAQILSDINKIGPIIKKIGLKVV